MCKPLSNFKLYFLLVLADLIRSTICLGEHSVARNWNEVALNAIRKDCWPVVHARNLFICPQRCMMRGLFMTQCLRLTFGTRVSSTLQEFDFYGEIESAG